MASNCSLIKPQNFQFHATGCDSTDINNKCSNNGQSRIVFSIDMPAGSNAVIARIQLTNTRTNQKNFHSINISEYGCSCHSLCIDNLGYKKNNKHIVPIIFNNLISGDGYSGTACLEYIL